jgi:hypothetical protein
MGRHRNRQLGVLTRPFSLWEEGLLFFAFSAKKVAAFHPGRQSKTSAGEMAEWFKAHAWKA